MVLRMVGPLDAVQWKNLCEDMKNGPSKEQEEKMAVVAKRVAKLRSAAKRSGLFNDRMEA